MNCQHSTKFSLHKKCLKRHTRDTNAFSEGNKNSRGAESLDCSLIYLLEFFFRLERAEPASVFAVLLLEVFVSVLLAAVATLEDVRTEFFFAIRFTSFQNNSEEAERTAERGRLPS